MTDEKTEKGMFEKQFEELLELKKEKQINEIISIAVKAIVSLLKKL